MVNKEAYQGILRCPITHSDLSWLSDEDLAGVNQKINGAYLQLLKTTGSDLYYPVVDDILYLLPEKAIKLSQESTDHFLPPVQKSVKDYYENVGWKKSKGVYQDACNFEDLRKVSEEYILNCHLRLKRFLPTQGKYLLDVACGPIQYPVYLTYSQNFEYRICADITLSALQEAKLKLGTKGLYVLCDITQLPFQSEKIDAVISLHTLYHVPADKQFQAYEEMNRILMKNGVSLVVYSWGGHSLLMNIFMVPQKIVNRLKNKFSSKSTSLYFHAFPYSWFIEKIRSNYNSQLVSWRSVNVPFLKLFIHSWLGGKSFLKAVFYLEERFPGMMGRFGAYPLWICKK